MSEENLYCNPQPIFSEGSDKVRKEIISKLEFSGILCIDEYKPKRSKTYDLIVSDRLTDRIIYLENLPKLYSPKAKGGVAKGLVEDFACKLKGFGLKSYACIVDLSSVYPKQLKKVWPDIIIQFDYFHLKLYQMYHY